MFCWASVVPMIGRGFGLGAGQSVMEFRVLIGYCRLKRRPRRSTLSILRRLCGIGNVGGGRRGGRFVGCYIAGGLENSTRDMHGMLDVCARLNLLVGPGGYIECFGRILLPRLPRVFMLSCFMAGLLGTRRIG